jgi:coatomer protein complex subunit epsilon
VPKNHNNVIALLHLTASLSLRFPSPAPIVTNASRNGSLFPRWRCAYTTNAVNCEPTDTLEELTDLHSALHQGQFQRVVDFDVASVSSAVQPHARLLQVRALLGLGRAADAAKLALTSGAGHDATLADAAAACCAVITELHPATGAGAAEPSPAALAKLEALARGKPTELAIQLLCGTALVLSGRAEDALALLGRHEGSLDA